MDDLFDISAWCQRAEQFVRGLNNIPGMWKISVAVKPPLDVSHLAAEEFRYEIPPLLRKLYTEVSADFRCTYYLKHGKAYGFSGGPHFTPWASLPRALGFDLGWQYEDDLTEEQKKAAEICERTLCLINVGNGDQVALHFTDDPEFMPVVYICHEDMDDSVTFLAESLQRFLVVWEQLSYIGPEFWPKGDYVGGTWKELSSADLEKEAIQWRDIVVGGQTSKYFP